MFLNFAINDDCYMIAALAYTVATTLWCRAHPFQHTSTINKNGFYYQVCVSSIATFVFLFPVVNSAFQQFSQRNSIVLWMVFQYSQSFFYLHTTNQIGEQTHLPGTR